MKRAVARAAAAAAFVVVQRRTVALGVIKG